MSKLVCAEGIPNGIVNDSPPHQDRSGWIWATPNKVLNVCCKRLGSVTLSIPTPGGLRRSDIVQLEGDLSPKVAEQIFPSG